MAKGNSLYDKLKTIAEERGIDVSDSKNVLDVLETIDEKLGGVYGDAKAVPDAISQMMSHASEELSNSLETTLFMDARI